MHHIKHKSQLSCVRDETTHLHRVDVMSSHTTGGLAREKAVRVPCVAPHPSPSRWVPCRPSATAPMRSAALEPMDLFNSGSIGEKYGPRVRLKRDLEKRTIFCIYIQVKVLKVKARGPSRERRGHAQRRHLGRARSGGVGLLPVVTREVSTSKCYEDHA